MTLVAGASLGSTDDPTALVVGSVETVESIATRFSDTASDVDARRTALSRVRAASWTGVAADAGVSVSGSADISGRTCSSPRA